ncbi:unnamed protein product, partial [Amoebophrya sp. A25]
CNLSQQGIRGIAPLAAVSFRNVRVLDLSCNRLTTVLDQLQAELPCLEQLDLSFNIIDVVSRSRGKLE